MLSWILACTCKGAGGSAGGFSVCLWASWGWALHSSTTLAAARGHARLRADARGSARIRTDARGCARMRADARGTSGERKALSLSGRGRPGMRSPLETNAELYCTVLCPLRLQGALRVTTAYTRTGLNCSKVRENIVLCPLHSQGLQGCAGTCQGAAMHQYWGCMDLGSSIYHTCNSCMYDTVTLELYCDRNL